MPGSEYHGEERGVRLATFLFVLIIYMVYSVVKLNMISVFVLSDSFLAGFMEAEASSTSTFYECYKFLDLNGNTTATFSFFFFLSKVLDHAFHYLSL